MRNELTDLDDTGLACLAKDGDALAFEEIYNRHVSGIAKALVPFAGGDRDLLDDLTQEVFFRVIAGLSSYVPTHPFAHWLYTVALNVGRNHVRRRQRITFLDAGELENLSNQNHAVADWSDEVIATRLFQLAAHLPEHLLDVFSLRIGSGMTFGEIAEILGIPEGTARSRMHNALGILRAEIGLKISSQVKRSKDEEGNRCRGPVDEV